LPPSLLRIQTYYDEMYVFTRQWEGWKKFQRPSSHLMKEEQILEKLTLANFQPQIIVITLFPFFFSKIKIRVKAKRVNFKEEL